MILKDVQRQNGKYVEGMFTVIRVDQPTPSDHGFRQIVRVADGYKKEADFTVWHTDSQSFLEPTWLGKQAMFRVRFKNDYYQGHPSTAEPEPDQHEAPDWDEINLGKCRHGILCGLIQHEGLPTDVHYESTGDGIADIDSTITLDGGVLAIINKLARFSMTGEIE